MALTTGRVRARKNEGKHSNASITWQAIESVWTVETGPHKSHTQHRAHRAEHLSNLVLEAIEIAR